MSYIAGTYGLGPLGIPNDDARIVCDGCGLVWRFDARRPPPAWFLDGKPPKGWKGSRADGKRTDYCPRCRTGGKEGTP